MYIMSRNWLGVLQKWREYCTRFSRPSIYLRRFTTSWSSRFIQKNWQLRSKPCVRTFIYTKWNIWVFQTIIEFECYTMNQNSYGHLEYHIVYNENKSINIFIWKIINLSQILLVWLFPGNGKDWTTSFTISAMKLIPHKHTWKCC